MSSPFGRGCPLTGQQMSSPVEASPSLSRTRWACSQSWTGCCTELSAGAARRPRSCRGGAVNLEDLRTSRSAVVTVAQAASVSGVDVRTVTRAIQHGELPALRLGRRVLIPRLPLLACLGVTADGDLAEAADPRLRIDGSKGAPETTVQA